MSHLAEEDNIQIRLGERMSRINRRKRRMIRAAAVLVLLAAAVAACFVFQVKKVTVYGNERHSSEEISAGLCHDFLTNNTLYLLWRHRDGMIPDELPFLNTLHIQMKSPSSIEVHVTEKKLAGYIDKNGYVYFDEDGTVLEMSDKIYEDIPLITGVSTSDVTLYQKLPTQSSAQLRTILSLTELLAYHKLGASEIRFGDNMEITVFIDGVEAQLGQDEYLEEKIANLSKIIPRLEGESGSLHLESFTGRNETVSFTPSGSDVTQESGDGADTDSQDNTAGTDPSGDGTDGDGASDADGTSDQDGASDAGDNTQGEAEGGEDLADQEDTGDTGTIYPMVYDSSGTLVYNVHVENGVVVDSNGNPVSGVIVNESGNVQDAYMNQFDPSTGELIQ